jgi:carbon-monoxide dehydrogenase medium subunit
VWREYIQPKSVDQALEILGAQRERARIVAGATDLFLELERGARDGLETLVDVTRVPGLNQIGLGADDIIRLGPLVTHNDCVASDLIRASAFPLAQAAWEVGAPQIRNRGTVAGNLITASPANDTITPLMALGAAVTLTSGRGSRRIALQDFYLGVRKTVMEPDEMLTEISFPAMTSGQRGIFLKLALRSAQAISVVNVSIVLDMQGMEVRGAAIALGAVAPTIIHAEAAESFLEGKKLDAATADRAALLTQDASRPIDDLRGSAAYRKEMVRVLTRRALLALRDGTERRSFPANPVLLRGPIGGTAKSLDSLSQSSAVGRPTHHGQTEPIETVINGKPCRLSPGHAKSLLRLLREDAGLTGSKEGCAEGECGACTVFLDGEAVMSCLVPAPRAHQAAITTIEGLAQDGQLHRVQRAFVEDGAVQCGYCTPGFVMSGAKLLEENPMPDRNAIEQALTGNLCRCTGYYKIMKAVEDASREPA